MNILQWTMLLGNNPLLVSISWFQSSSDQPSSWLGLGGAKVWPGRRGSKHVTGPNPWRRFRHWRQKVSSPSQSRGTIDSSEWPANVMFLCGKLLVIITCLHVLWLVSEAVDWLTRKQSWLSFPIFLKKNKQTKERDACREMWRYNNVIYIMGGAVMQPHKCKEQSKQTNLCRGCIHGNASL